MQCGWLKMLLKLNLRLKYFRDLQPIVTSVRGLFFHSYQTHMGALTLYNVVIHRINTSQGKLLYNLDGGPKQKSKQTTIRRSAAVVP